MRYYAFSKHVKSLLAFIFLLLLFQSAWALSQNKADKGESHRYAGFKKYLKNFNRGECGGLYVNRAILQDKHGVMYFGGEGGLREFNGVSWRSIRVRNDWVSAMAIDESGVIYIGGNNEIGYLAPDEKGALQYKSLVHLLEHDQRNFTVLNVHATAEGIYFNAGKFLFRKNSRPGKTTISVWKPGNGSERGFDFSFTCGGALFIQEEGSGLKQMAGDSLRLVPGYEAAAVQKICMLTAYSPGKKLVGTRSNKLYIHDGTTLAPFRTEADEYLKENRLIRGIRLASGDVALATFFGGVVIIDNDGGITDIFDKTSGLPNNLVNYVFEDSRGNLWLALEAGISMIENISPLSTCIEPPKFIHSVIKHQDVLYVSAKDGLFFLAPGGTFRLVPGMAMGCGDLLSAGDSLLAATVKGLFAVKGGKINKITGDLHCKLRQSEMDKNRVWVQSIFKIFSLYRENGEWVKKDVRETNNRFIYTVVEDENGKLWAGIFDTHSPIPAKAVLKINYADASVNRYDRSSGFPAELNGILKAADHVIFSTNRGIFRFDEDKKAFIADYSLGKQMAAWFAKKSVRRLVEDSRGDIWVSFHDGGLLQAVYLSDGTYAIDEKPFSRIPRDVEITGVYPEPGGDITWLYGKHILIRFDRRLKKNYRCHFRPLIHKVQAGKELLFAGYTTGNEWNEQGALVFPGISYESRNLRFEFAAPFFEGESPARYRYFLEGHDNSWSGWAPDAVVIYNDLEPGRYRFRVQAENVYRQPGREAVLGFKILLPWYRTWWAFLSYGFIFFILTYLVVKWRRAVQLELDKQRLEKIVEERVEEINRKNRQLKTQTLRLKEQAGKLKEMDKVKSRFFANISHEFRTPLALIMGPLEQMIAADDWNRDEWKKRLPLMLRNAVRLLRLIDQLLELSKLESGKMKLKAYPQDIVGFLKGIAASFEPVADKNELYLSVQADDDRVFLYFDPGKMEEVMFNLLSNAVKFTPAGGEITVSVSRDPGAAEHFPRGSVYITICDTGPGIPREQMSYIFDRFYQADSTHEHHKKGSGIGLAIAKELVELHHGKIEARNRDGLGAEFVVRLPLGSDHLKPGEIIDWRGEPYRHKQSGKMPAHYMMEQVEENFSLPLDKAKPIILVVEDSPDFREYVKEALEPLYHVVIARDGSEGVQRALEIIPDLIISDVMMPGKDGYQLCREVKENRETSHIPVILLTARASDHSIVLGLETGADDYITKPFNSTILAARIKNLVDQRRRQQLERRRQMTVKPLEIEVSSVDEAFYKELEAVLEENLANPEFNIEQLKNKLCMGRTTLYRKIMALTGLSPNRFIRTYRLKRAAQLLKANFGNVSEVAVEVGFTNMAYFSQCFKEEFQQSPSLYQGSRGGGAPVNEFQ